VRWSPLCTAVSPEAEESPSLEAVTRQRDKEHWSVSYESETSLLSLERVPVLIIIHNSRICTFIVNILSLSKQATDIYIGPLV
jgi:hypothetical protein